ncbi:MAG: MMPL family transporter [Oscillospiraceae bacterium]|nr:MMPL family transporter [Oscillospiraceae bacterium]
MSAQKSEKKNMLYKLATFIVDKRSLFFLIYILAIIFSVFSLGWVKVNEDTTSYLAEDTETRKGIVIMAEEFFASGTGRIMVENVTVEQAKAIAEDLGRIEGVSMVTFTGDEDSYKGASALFDVTFAGETADEISEQAMDEIKAYLADYDAYIDSDVGYDMNEVLASEMLVIMAVASVIVLAVLLLTSQAYAEVLVLLLTFLAAAAINMGTNFIYGEISFVSNSVTVVLQLALAIDYAIIMCHRFSEERAAHNNREACILALSKAIPEIASSSLTTISGMAALMFMQFGLGADMGKVLIKSIIISLLSVFTLMPGLLMLFAGALKKTKHRSFIPRIDFWGRLMVKLRYVVPPIFIIVVVAAFILSSNCPYAFGYSTLATTKMSDAQIAEEKIKENFGTQNIMAIIVPSGDYESEAAFLRDLEACEEVNYAMGLANVEAIDGYTLTSGLTTRDFAELTDMDIEVVQLLYTAYAVSKEDMSEVFNDINSYPIPLIDMFLYLSAEMESGMINLDEDMAKMLEEMGGQLEGAMSQLQSDKHSRMVVSLDLPMEGEEVYAFMDVMHELGEQYYGEGNVLIVGEATSARDLAESFTRDNLLISILTAVFVMVILLFTFKSAGLPVLLILVIQGSIWINFSFPTLQRQNIFFMGYLIVSAIQMGANIDYAIVLSSRYLELKKTMPYKDAMVEAMNLAFPTVMTSGVILSSAGMLISYISTEPSIYTMGLCIGRGTMISMVLVLGVLPEILVFGDAIIEKTSFKVPLPELRHEYKGEMSVHGRVRGYVNGYVDAVIHGTVRGEVNAIVETDAVTVQTAEKEAAEQ